MLFFLSEKRVAQNIFENKLSKCLLIRKFYVPLHRNFAK